MSDITEELGRLADLRDRGVLTQEEFDQQKAALLHPPADASPKTSADATTAAPAAAAAAAPVVAERPAKPRPPGYAPPTAGSNTAVFVIVGVVALIVIVLALWATGVFRPHGTNSASTAGTDSSALNLNLSTPTTSPSSAATPLASSTPLAAPATPAASDDSWLMGQWENVAAPACAQWLRFGSDHSLGDNADGSGSWSLAPGADGGYTLSMNITGTGLRQGPLTHDSSAGTITMGAGPGAVTWRKTTC